MHWVHSQVIVLETSPFFCSSELGTRPGVHRVSALYGCCVWVCMGVPVSNRYQCAPRIYDAAPKTVEFLSGRVSVSFWPWQWRPGKVTWWAAGTVVLSQGPPLHEPGWGCECCLDHSSRSITGSGFSSENGVLEEERVIWAASGKEGSNLGFWVAVLAQVILNSFLAVI